MRLFYVLALAAALLAFVVVQVRGSIKINLKVDGFFFGRASRRPAKRRGPPAP